jgi:membrane-bound lytic murein transglycosylase D
VPPSASPSKLASSSRHRVRAGETLYSIAKLFEVSVRDLREANGLGHASRLPVGKVLRIPPMSVEETPEQASVVPENPPATPRKVHVVRKGETLYSISRRLGVRQEDLRDWNGLEDSDLKAGQKLVYHPSGT